MLRDVSMVFGAADHAADTVRALRHVDLDIRAGEFVTLIGPSGCGKSTLLRLVGDLLAPTEGTIQVNGNPPRQACLAREYGMVFQQPVLYDWRPPNSHCLCLHRHHLLKGSRGCRWPRPPGGSGSIARASMR